MSDTLTLQQPPIEYLKDKRYFGRAAKAFALWIRNPVSEGGAKQIFRMMYSLAGPEIHRKARHMKRDERFAYLFTERPDLGKALTDMAALKELPEGSLGKGYHDFMDGEGIFPGYVIAGLAYRNGHFDGLVDWDEDAKYLVLRAGNTHDITHVIGGYGSDFSGEVINIAFSIGAAGMIPSTIALGAARVWGFLSAIALRPTIGIKNFVSVCMDAARRGVIMGRNTSLLQIPYESLLNQPLPLVRQQLGLPPHKHVEYVKDGWIDSAGWAQSRFAKKMESGFGKQNETADRVQKVRELVEQGGLTIRELMTAPSHRLVDVYMCYYNGGTLEQMRKILAK